VTDFAPDLPDGERAGLEAALEAAGILDAWVTPDGDLVDGDVIVVSGLAPVAGPSCGAVLVPAIDAADARRQWWGRVGRVRSAGYWTWVWGWGRRHDLGDHRRAVVERCAWRRLAQGPGRLHRRRAREAARRTRIELLERELAQERTAIERLDADLADVAARRELVADEHRAVPPDGGVRDAHTGAAVERRGLARAREDHAAAVAVCERRQGSWPPRGREPRSSRAMSGCRGSGRAGRRAGGRGGVPGGAGRPVARRRGGPRAIRAAADAETELDEGRQLLIEASERAAEAIELAATAAMTYEQLLATVGTAVEELQRRLAEATDALAGSPRPSGSPATGSRRRSGRGQGGR